MLASDAAVVEEKPLKLGIVQEWYSFSETLATPVIHQVLLQTESHIVDFLEYGHHDFPPLPALGVQFDHWIFCVKHTFTNMLNLLLLIDVILFNPRYKIMTHFIHNLSLFGYLIIKDAHLLLFLILF